jgi:predicted transposase YdaD
MFPGSFFKLLGEKERKGYDIMSVELKETSFRIDCLAIPKNKDETIYFIEPHFYREPIIPKLFAEIFIYLNQKKVDSDWRAVVIYPNRSIGMKVGKAYKQFIETGKLSLIYLNELPDEIMNEYPISLWKIIIAEEDRVRETVKEVIKSLPKAVKARGESDETIDLLIKLITSKLPQITIEEITYMVDELVIDMKKTRVGRDLISIGWSDGIIEGKTEDEVGEVVSEYFNARLSELAKTQVMNEIEAAAAGTYYY